MNDSAEKNPPRVWASDSACFWKSVQNVPLDMDNLVAFLRQIGQNACADKLEALLKASKQ